MVDTRGLMINRLIVLLQVIVFPLYFYMMMIFGPMKDASLGDFFFWSAGNPLEGTPEIVILKVLTPLIFALPFSLASIVKATRIADSYDLMWRAMGRVRIDTKIFYMVNAIFCLFFLILPFGAPIIAVFGAFFAVKLILYAFGIKKNVPAILIVIPGIILAAIPLMVAIAFFANFDAVFKPSWQFWTDYSPIFYGIVLCLACAIAIVNFFMLIREGASQVSYNREVTDRVGLILKIFLFGGILALFAFVDKWSLEKGTAKITAMVIVNIVAVVLSSLETIIRWRKKQSKSNGGGGGGTLMVPIFIAANFFIYNFARPDIVVTIIVAVSALIFFALFIYAYKSATDETLFE